MREKHYSYELERKYYSESWPEKPVPYEHLEAYLTNWLNTEDVFNGKRVLDIGAGECAYTRLISAKFKPKEIIAADLFIKRMLPAAKNNRNGKLKFVQADLFQLPFANSSFDVVFGSLVLEQIPDLEDCISEISRILTKKGVYVGIEANTYNPKHLFRYFFGEHSANQFLLRGKHLKVFNKYGFDLKLKYFFGRNKLIRDPFLSTLIGIKAEKIRIQL